MNNKIIILILVIVMFAAGIAGLLFIKNSPTQKNVTENSSELSSDFTDYTNQAEINIFIKDNKYTPDKIRIKKGTVVTWINEDDMEHNAMRDHDENIPHDDIEVAGFNGPLLAKGESWSYTFETESGQIGYHCAPHPFMKGQIEVVE
jgi:plastocyanin